jgi:hypothetical protein
MDGENSSGRFFSSMKPDIIFLFPLNYENRFSLGNGIVIRISHLPAGKGIRFFDPADFTCDDKRLPYLCLLPEADLQSCRFRVDRMKKHDPIHGCIQQGAQNAAVGDVFKTLVLRLGNKLSHCSSLLQMERHLQS